jgi:hypothetical protein
MAAFVQKAGSETWTGVSGVRGSMSRDVETTAEYYALRAVTLWRYTGHRPCALGVEEAPFRAAGDVPLDTLRTCEFTAGQEWKRVDVGEGRFVTAIAICTNMRAKVRTINGVLLWSATLDRDGRLGSERERSGFQFRECNEWQRKRECPAGAVATGIRAFFSHPEHGLVGLSLRCHELEQNPSNGVRRAG